MRHWFIMRTAMRRWLTLTVVVVWGVTFGQAQTTASVPSSGPQYQRLTWDARNGLYGAVQAIGQAPNGLLFIGTSDGLFSFDGMTFSAVRFKDGSGVSGSISALLPLPNNDVIVGYTLGGASLLSGGKVQSFSEEDGFPAARVRAFARTPDGAIWAAAVGGLARFANGRWQRIRTDWGFPGGAPWTVFTDSGGRLWVPSTHGLLYLDNGSHRFVNTSWGADRRDFALAEMANGALVALEGIHGRLEMIPCCRAAPRMEGWVPSNSGGALLRDARGGFWTVSEAPRIWRTTMRLPLDVDAVPKNDRVQTSEGELLALPTDGTANMIAQDRQGNVWIGTEAGLERLRLTPFNLIPLPASSWLVLVSGPDSRIYVADKDMDMRDAATGAVVAGSPHEVLCSYRDAEGTTWIGAQGHLLRWTRAGFEEIFVPDEFLPPRGKGAKDPLLVTAITSSKDGSMWFSVAGVGELRLSHGHWERVVLLPPNIDWAPRSAYTDPAGDCWFVLSSYVIQMEGEHTRAFSKKDGLSIGKPNILSGFQDEVWVGGESGIALYRKGSFTTMQGYGGEQFGFVTGIVRQPSGLWLTTTRGVLFISDHEIQNFKNNADYKPVLQRFNLVAGLLEQLERSNAYSSAVLADATGMLWFAAKDGVACLNTADAAHTSPNPNSLLLALSADDQPYDVRPVIRLLPRTRRIEFQYTATDLADPLGSVFRYRLDRFDASWHEVGRERMAAYSNLRPGAYHFRVSASNGQRSWGPESVLTVVIPPAWNQTAAFYVAAVFLILIAALALFVIERRRYARSLQMTFDARLAERTSLARDLHDTLLQTLHGSKIVADHAQESISDVPEAKKILQLLSKWLMRADSEGRAVLNALRSVNASEDLVAAIKTAADESLHADQTLHLNVRGRVRDVHPVIQSEIRQICGQAVRNASLHSGADEIVVDLIFTSDLVMTIADRGKGFQWPSDSKAGHFGIIGMRERAEQIHGTLEIKSIVGEGTTVRLCVPGELAFVRSRGFLWLYRIWNRFHETEL